jgi:hypothetical protein
MACNVGERWAFFPSHPGTSSVKTIENYTVIYTKSQENY